MSTGKVVLGTLAGLAVGAIAGILFAPKKGSNTRMRILLQADEYADELKAKVHEFSHSLSDKFKRSKKDAEQLVDKAKAKYEDAKKDLKNETAAV